MTNGKKLRLIQVAKEFNVGLNTITDFLQKKGIKSDGSPNTPVEPDVYAVLEKEFGSNRGAGSERESIRERIAQKQATVTLDEARRQAREEEQEIVIKSRIISEIVDIVRGMSISLEELPLVLQRLRDGTSGQSVQKSGDGGKEENE